MPRGKAPTGNINFYFWFKSFFANSGYSKAQHIHILYEFGVECSTEFKYEFCFWFWTFKFLSSAILQIRPWTLPKSQVIHTCVDFGKCYMFLDQNQARILLVYFLLKFGQIIFMFVPDLHKIPSILFLLYFYSSGQMMQTLYLFARIPEILFSQ